MTAETFANRWQRQPFRIDPVDHARTVHTHRTAGGQGMNTALVDAYTLGRLLADVVQGRAAPGSPDH